MLKYLGLLLVLIIVQIITYVLTPFLPLFAVLRWGLINNGNETGIEPRLPLWLSEFDTPDNSLLGDENWKASHSGGYWSQVGWLYRNSLYGFKWTKLAAPMNPSKIEGKFIPLDYHKKQLGTMRLKMGEYWQYKSVFIKWNRIFILNFGWLLEDTSKEHALFMCSPRWKKL